MLYIFSKNASVLRSHWVLILIRSLLPLPHASPGRQRSSITVLLFAAGRRRGAKLTSESEDSAF